MNVEGKSESRVELNHLREEWVQLSKLVDDSNGVVLFDAGNKFVLARVDSDPVKIVDSGKEVRAEVLYDRQAQEKELQEQFGDALTSHQVQALFEWYESFVNELVELDLYDDSYQTPVKAETAYISGVSRDFLAEEIQSVIEDWECSVAPDIAACVTDWSTDGEVEGLDSSVHAARIILV